MPTRRAVSLLAATPLLPASLLSLAQHAPTMRRVGLLMYSVEGPGIESLASFSHAMHLLGWDEGRNVVFRPVYAHRDLSRLEGLAEALVKDRAEVILVTTSPSVRAAQHATKTVPIVFTPLSNVLGNGYVASLARPGGNVTGIASQFEDVLPKLIEFLHAIAPAARRIAILVNENNLSHGAFWNAAVSACATLDLSAHRVVATAAAQFGSAVDDMVRQRAQAVVVSNDFLFIGERARLHELLMTARLPAGYGFRDHVVAGGLLSYGSSFVAGFEQAATYVDRILRGAKPADLPVEQPTKFELAINLATARALGLTIPQTVLLRADEIIR